jgi:hypothetical protein
LSLASSTGSEADDSGSGAKTIVAVPVVVLLNRALAFGVDASVNTPATAATMNRTYRRFKPIS